MSKQLVLGSLEWLELQRSGAFDNRPPVPWEPPPKHNVAVQTADAIAAWPEAQYGPYIARGLRVFVGQPCAYCDVPMKPRQGRKPTRDHIIPRCLGGTQHVQNILIVCEPCNHDKGGLTLQEFARKLAIDDPRKARILELAEQYPYPPPERIMHLVDRWEMMRRQNQRAATAAMKASQ